MVLAAGGVNAALVAVAIRFVVRGGRRGVGKLLDSEARRVLSAGRRSLAAPVCS